MTTRTASEAATTCDRCGKPYTIGDWPYCPHGRTPAYHPFIPYWDEHVSTSPTYITSQAERWSAMRHNHMDYKGKRVGDPGCEV